MHRPGFEFFEGKKKRHATATIDCRRGLRAEDDAYLWAMLANALREPEPQLVSYCGVRYLLRTVGLSESGRSTELLRQVLHRLGGVRYSNDHFYDPIKHERRSVDFGFLSTDIPRNKDSFRPWRIGWDPLFFEYVQAWGGFLGFDLDTYRSLRPATGRLYLYLKKLLFKRNVTHYINVQNLATHTLGFSATLRVGEQNRKVRQCASELAGLGIITLSDPKELIEVVGSGRGKGYRCRFHRGSAFEQSASKPQRSEAQGPTFDLLQQVGLDANVAARMLQDYPTAMLSKWADVALAGKEAGAKFRTGPEAFFVASVKADAKSGRPLPEWYHRLRKEEELASWEEAAKNVSDFGRKSKEPQKSEPASFAAHLKSESGRAHFERLLRDVFEGDASQALSHLRREFDAASNRKEEARPAALGKILGG